MLRRQIQADESQGLQHFDVVGDNLAHGTFLSKVADNLMCNELKQITRKEVI